MLADTEIVSEGILGVEKVGSSTSGKEYAGVGAVTTGREGVAVVGANEGRAGSTTGSMEGI